MSTHLLLMLDVQVSMALSLGSSEVAPPFQPLAVWKISISEMNWYRDVFMT